MRFSVWLIRKFAEKMKKFFTPTRLADKILRNMVFLLIVLFIITVVAIILNLKLISVLAVILILIVGCGFMLALPFIEDLVEEYERGV